MAADHYLPCPCGSGKKLKFCKCVEQPQDYEKIVKLIEGGQAIAAVDRINQMLSKTPNAAWLLAIKGELTLSMREIDSFKETANRFLKLKPDNPLALVMRSIVAIFDEEPIENAARYLLEGMSEARESLPGLTLAAIRLLIGTLTDFQKRSMIGYWSEIFDSLTGGEGQEESALHDASISLLAKSPVLSIDDPAGAAWKERLAEVHSLTRTFRFAQAEKKLIAILRDFPDQPGPLTHLLRGQCAQLDQHGAHSTALKLSNHLELTPEQRAYYGAVAMELEPGSKSLNTTTVHRYCETDSLDLAEESLRTLDFAEQGDGEQIEQARQYYGMLVGDEVPAKAIYSLFDRPAKPAAEEATQESEPAIARLIGTVVLYGKQTDKAARVLVLAHPVKAYQEKIDQVLDLLQLGTELEANELTKSARYIEFLQRPKLALDRAGLMLSIEARSRELVDDFLQMPMEIFDGQTPLDVANDEKLRGKLTSLLYHLESEQSIVVLNSSIDEIYKRLDIERPTFTVDLNADSLRLKTLLEMERVDVDALNPRQLNGLMFRAISSGSTRVFYRCAVRVRALPADPSNAEPRMAALSGLLGIETGIDERIAICEELEPLLASIEAPVGKIVIQRVSLLHAAGRSEEAQQLMIQSTQKYPNDPFLLSFLQYAMQAQGGRMPGVGMRQNDELSSRMMQNASRSSGASQSNSGLVLPGQAEESSGGESKLWLPGS